MKLLRWIFVASICIGVTGCILPLPQNVNPTPQPARTLAREEEGANFFTEEGLEDAFWVEVARVNEPGTVGGYLSHPGQGEHSDALVITLDGASTFDPGGPEQDARRNHKAFGLPFRDKGYMTWSLALRECGTAYGQGDLADTVEAVDWLERSGKTILGVSRIYVVGYSRGATVATLLNRKRRVTAAVSIGGLAEPNQLEDGWFLYQLAGELYPLNTGLCQLRSTLEFYGGPGSAAWDALDSVAHVSEFQSPMLFVHGTKDQIYVVENTYDLQAAYDQALAMGAVLPAVQFKYVENADHFAVTDSDELTDWVLDFLNQFEPAAN